MNGGQKHGEDQSNMALAVVKKTLLKYWIWCRQHWRWLVFTIAVLAAYIAGSKRHRTLMIQAKLARKQYEKEAKAIETAHGEAIQKKKEADAKYKRSLIQLDKKYNDKNSKLERSKDKEYKRLLSNARKDPEKLDALLTSMGINEV